jgi:hypothetical protein
VGRDDEIAVLAGRERNGDGRRQAALGPAPVQHLAHGADVQGVALEGFDESVFELLSADDVKELKETSRVAAEVFAALGEAAKERLAARRGLGETVEPAMLPSALLFCGYVSLGIMAPPHAGRGGPRGGRGARPRTPLGCDHRRAQTGSGEPQNE